MSFRKARCGATDPRYFEGCAIWKRRVRASRKPLKVHVAVHLWFSAMEHNAEWLSQHRMQGFAEPAALSVVDQRDVKSPATVRRHIIIPHVCTHCNRWLCRSRQEITTSITVAAWDARERAPREVAVWVAGGWGQASRCDWQHTLWRGTRTAAIPASLRI